MPLFKGLRDTLEKIKHSGPKPVFCPNCKSLKMKVKESFGILPSRYSCSDCGYEGSLVLELEPEEE
ncbi:MAG: hypothetical protein NWE89_10575 [Candidatus Bathyarchaeota archaeon]|nr:hypothetical protein [Candidatus Bathyarchaeota archaeon]